MAISKTLRFQILRRDNNTCRTCGRSAPEVKLHVDHVVPEALGGRTEASNLQTLCSDCNSGKSATPPDAAMVDQVSADALRWADAQQVVVARMLSEMKSRTRIYNKVDKLWKEYGDVRRPADWRRSIDQFLDAGLPPEMILRAAETALGKQTIRAGDCFKYMCGIAWSRISEIREGTQNAVAPAAPSESPDETVGQLRSLVEEIYEYLGEDEIDEYTKTARSFHPEQTKSEDGLRVAVASLAWNEVWTDLHNLDTETWEMVRALPEHIRDIAHERTMADLKESSYPSIMAQTRYMLRNVSAAYAREFLNTLDISERAEWLAGSRARVGESASEARVEARAAEQARIFKSGKRGAAKGMCSNAGDHGALCPNRSTHTIWIIDCVVCKEKCDGHEGLCERHLIEAQAGRAKRNDGSPFKIEKAEPLPEDPWAAA